MGHKRSHPVAADMLAVAILAGLTCASCDGRSKQDVFLEVKPRTVSVSGQGAPSEARLRVLVFHDIYSADPITGRVDLALMLGVGPEVAFRPGSATLAEGSRTPVAIEPVSVTPGPAGEAMLLFELDGVRIEDGVTLELVLEAVLEGIATVEVRAEGGSDRSRDRTRITVLP